MKITATLVPSTVLAAWVGFSCASAPAPAPVERAASPEWVEATDFWAGCEHRVQGVIVDAAGQPLRGKVAVVDAGGSSSSGVSAGTFEVGTDGGFPKTLSAWTEDGLFTSRILRSSADAETFQELTLVERGAFLELQAGETDQRVTVLAAGTPLHDVSFPAGVVRSFVVPATEVSFGAYAGGTTPGDRALRTARLGPGERLAFSFE